MARFLKLLVTILAVLPVALSQCNIHRAETFFRRSVYEFSAELLRRIAEDTEGHFVASTVSPWTLISAIALGAADDTLAQIKLVLKHSEHKCFNSKFLELAKRVESGDRSATLERSSSLFIDETTGLNQAFKAELAKTGVCEINALSFEDFSAAATAINNYVKDATHGVIEEIISPGDLQGMYLIMVDVMYFKGVWRKAFSPEDTEISTFYDSNRNPIGDVNLMFINSEFNVTSIDAIQAQVLELPYGEDGRYSMLVFLPYDGVSVINVIGSLKRISLGSIFGLFRQRGPQTVLVQLPKFRISSDLDNLKDFLIDMGLKDMFDSSRARFPDLSEYELHVASFIHKADIEVSEEGTVAAGASELGMTFRSSILPQEFLVNKPFLFMVVDRLTQVPVFSGAYSKPSVL